MLYLVKFLECCRETNDRTACERFNEYCGLRRKARDPILDLRTSQVCRPDI